MTPINILQKAIRIHELRNHVKSQLSFHAFEKNEVQKVHFQKLLPTLARLLTNDRYKAIQALFDISAKKTVAQQLLQLLSSMGEIANASGGYYLPLPVRAVELPVSKKIVLLSETINHETTIPYVGIASDYGDENSTPVLTINDWLPSISIQEFVEIIKHSQSYEITDDPTQVFVAKERREWSNYEIIRNQPRIDFIAKFHSFQGVTSYYWAKKRKDKISYFTIPNQYLDLAKYTLENLKGIHRKIEAEILNDNFIKMKFHHRLPKTERIMLMLFAFPENFYDPFHWIVPKVHLEDFIFIVNKLGMKIKEH